MITLTSTQIDTICDSLRGTTGDLEETINDEMSYEIGSISDIDSVSLDAIDERIFLCEECGWWCSVDELSTDENDVLICDECAPGEEEERLA